MTFTDKEMKVLRAIFRGECSVSRLTEGGDYLYVCWCSHMTRDEVDAFLAKLED